MFVFSLTFVAAFRLSLALLSALEAVLVLLLAFWASVYNRVDASGRVRASLAGIASSSLSVVFYIWFFCTFISIVAFVLRFVLRDIYVIKWSLGCLVHRWSCPLPVGRNAFWAVKMELKQRVLSVELVLLTIMEAIFASIGGLFGLYGLFSALSYFAYSALPFVASVGIPPLFWFLLGIALSIDTFTANI